MKIKTDSDLLPVFCLLVDEVQANQTDDNTDDFAQADDLVIQQPADEKQCTGDKGTLHDTECAHRPADLVCIK